MELVAGRRLGPYEIVAPLGAGGMGEVYRARDTRLGRDVAVKVLPGHRAGSAEVRARFEREAKTVSGLNHPHICALFDVGSQDGTDYLVMELVEGETLAHRLARGALPPAEVLKVGAQIADALDRAHRAGVVHRDLKPGNVMLTKTGAKLMDFGLARATGLAAAPSGTALTYSPTLAQPLTAEGTIVGTFQYMSPEQLEGKEADPRSDLWALGCVLYEMATGKRAFDGASQASLIGAIMNAEPAPISQIAPLAPPALDRVVRACLAKDPDERIQTAHDVKLELQWATESGTQTGAPAVTRARRGAGRERIAWGVAALATVLAVLAFAPWTGHREDAGPVHLALLPPENVTIDDELMHTAISPDGRAVVFRGIDAEGHSQLWLRELDSPEARPLPGTDNAFLAFWSPDSRSIGFVAQSKLRKIERSGQAAQILCEAPDMRGAAWSPRGVILFAPSSAGPLFRVPEGGGPAVQALALDQARGEIAHRFPSFLPDGRHFLYVSLGNSDTVQTRVGSLDSPETHLVLSSSMGACYAAPGFLLYERDEALLAQRFDEGSGRVTGEPQVLGSVPQDATTYAGGLPASVSANGAMVQRRRLAQLVQLVWLDRDGRTVAIVPSPPAHDIDLILSPGNDRVATVRTAGSGQDLWVIELATGIATRLTSDVKFPESPTWSPDGRWIDFGCIGDQGRELCRRLASGAGDVEVVQKLEGGFGNPVVWSPDGQNLLIRMLSATSGEDVWIMPHGGPPVPLLHARYHEEDPTISPNGRWIAYRSDESGRAELYVQSFPEPGAKFRISKEGAGQRVRSRFGRAFWRRDGRELLYVGGDGVTVMSVPIETEPGFSAGTPRPLFKIPPSCTGLQATSDAQRFLVLENVATTESASIQVTLHWPALLEKR